jgi:hypothetical protein
MEQGALKQCVDVHMSRALDSRSAHAMMRNYWFFRQICRYGGVPRRSARDLHHAWEQMCV